MIKVALEVLSVYGLVLFILCSALFIFISMIVILIKNWRDLMDE